MPPLADTVELDRGRQASYEVIGDGPPMLYFQGGPGFSAALLRGDATLLGHHFAVYLIDPHGSGRSSPPSDPSHYDHIGHARFYDDVRQALGVERAVVAGASFGGLVALTYAALYPDATSCCIAIGARAVGTEVEGDDAADEMQAFLARHESQSWYPSARKTWDEWTDRVLATDDASEVVEMMADVMPLYAADPDHPGVQALIAEWRQEAQSDLTAVKVWESGLWQRIDVRPLLSDIQCPTLVLVGALDMICGPAQGQMVADAIPGAVVAIVPDAGHFIPIESPERFREEIRGFAL